MREDAQDLDWTYIIEQSVENQLAAIKDKLFQLIEENVPKKKINPRSKAKPRWLENMTKALNFSSFLQVVCRLPIKPKIWMVLESVVIMQNHSIYNPWVLHLPLCFISNFLMHFPVH